MAQVRRALELDPLSAVINRNLGDVLLFQRKYDQAIEQYRKTLEIDPMNAAAINQMSWAYTHKGDYAQALAENQKITGPAAASQSSPLAYIYAKMGRTSEAQQLLAALQDSAKDRYVSPVVSARIYSALGDKDKAFESLDKAYVDHSISSATTMSIKVDPAYDALRSDSRFANLLHRINLQP
jgi:Tfp pilus assembly protein PilF